MHQLGFTVGLTQRLDCGIRQLEYKAKCERGNSGSALPVATDTGSVLTKYYVVLLVLLHLLQVNTTTSTTCVFICSHAYSIYSNIIKNLQLLILSLLYYIVTIALYTLV